MWAYAKMGAAVSTEVAALLDALAAEAVSQLRDARARQCFIPQNVSNMVYGCGAGLVCLPCFFGPCHLLGILVCLEACQAPVQ